MVKTTITIIALLFASLLFSCKGTGAKGTTTATDSLSMKLTEQQLGDSRFYLSLPQGYPIEPMNGADFVVYYFNYRPYDTVEQKIGSFRGGIYFGNHPSAGDSEEQTVELKESPIFGQTETWHIQQDDSTKAYEAYVLAKNVGGEEWQEYIHAFGVAATRQGIDSLLYVFATLRRQ